MNAKLATLTYTGTVAGTDDLSVVVLGQDGRFTPVIHTAVATIPLTGTPTAANGPTAFSTGTLTLDSHLLDGPELDCRQTFGAATSTTLVLINSTIGVHSLISVSNDNAGGTMPRLAIAGRVELDGSMAFAGAGTLATLARGATFFNEGSMTIDAHAAQFTGAGSFVNDGLITVTGDGSPGLLPRIDTALTGSGVISLSSGAAVELGGSVGAGQTIWLGAGSNTVHLGAPASFAGRIDGFALGDLLVLDGASVTGAICSRAADSGSAIVTLLDVTSILGSIRFAAPEAGTVFQLGADAAGNATISLAPLPLNGAAATIDVYRFFDAAHGTQLLTQDPAERDSILGSRPDLHYEGVGLHALDPARPDPNATAVYRFFDLGTGTHFMTASASERDTLLGSRPDFVFEPASTLYEHATAQPGDTPVYRFFDEGSGAHFFTADPGERASIVATRPDMAAEGIAFYAPAA